VDISLSRSPVVSSAAGGSKSLSSRTTDAEDELAAELGDNFSNELPISPTTLAEHAAAAAAAATVTSAAAAGAGDLDAAASAAATQMHAKLLAEQRERQQPQPPRPHAASTSLLSPPSFRSSSGDSEIAVDSRGRALAPDGGVELTSPGPARTPAPELEVDEPPSPSD
jgi:hypothetical protein